MASYTSTVITCDRCGHKEEIKDSYNYFDWTVFWIEKKNKPGEKPVGYDICKDCKKQYDDWWSAK